ncbi:unnamed protein product [Prunus brigantina]
MPSKMPQIQTEITSMPNNRCNLWFHTHYKYALKVIINLSWIHGSNWGLKPAKFMALTGGGTNFALQYADTWAMRGGRYKLESNYSGSRTFVMEFESDWTKYRKLPAYTAHVMRSATSFMPWSCKIPIGDGYHEFL